jgi:NADH-quinone oxidoreductase subunit D
MLHNLKNCARGCVTLPRLAQAPVAAFSWAGIRTAARLRTQFRQGTVAFGPQHPAAHGILKLQLQLHGEVLRWVDPQFGYLHRGTEKLMEGRNLLQALPYFDRFDYVANLFQEHAYCLAVEGLTRTATSLTAGVQLARLLFDEISRILNHLLTLSATALDLSVMGPIFWAFEEREALMELCEQASGARMHTALYRPYAFDMTVLSSLFLRELSQFLTRCSRSLAGSFLGLLNNRSLKSRLSFVGQLSLAKAQSYGITGLLARSCGGLYDLRLQAQSGYGFYRDLSLRVFLGRRGDNLDRFLLRIKETSESFRLLSQLLTRLQPRELCARQVASTPVSASLAYGRAAWQRTSGKGLDAALTAFVAWVAMQPWAVHIGVDQPALRVAPGVLALEISPARGKFGSMEALISHFRVASEGWATEAGWYYSGVESPKGEVGVCLVAGGGSRPVRVKLRTPVSHNMHLIPTIAVGATFADMVATFCSLDIVMGEIDR